jgi:hypothetical protein
MDNVQNDGSYSYTICQFLNGREYLASSNEYKWKRIRLRPKELTRQLCVASTDYNYVNMRKEPRDKVLLRNEAIKAYAPIKMKWTMWIKYIYVYIGKQVDR